MYLFRLDFVDCSLSAFLSFWAKCYDDGKYPDSGYENNLSRGRKLTKENIRPLLEWKNGKELSSHKRPFVERVICNLEKFNEFRSLSEVKEGDMKKFWDIVCRIVKSGLVWRVFLLHVARPNDYPIFDQHVLRAQTYIETVQITAPKITLEYYESSYIPFFRCVCQTSAQESRQVDKALMAFGQFLKSQFFKSDLLAETQSKLNFTLT